MNEFINTVHNNLPVTVSKNIHLRNNMRSEALVSVDITPVSYTHLDVYKRQQFYWGGRLLKSNGGVQRLAQYGQKSYEECKRKSKPNCETNRSSSNESWS